MEGEGTRLGLVVRAGPFRLSEVVGAKGWGSPDEIESGLCVVGAAPRSAPGDRIRGGEETKSPPVREGSEDCAGVSFPARGGPERVVGVEVAEEKDAVPGWPGESVQGGDPCFVSALARAVDSDNVYRVRGVVVKGDLDPVRAYAVVPLGGRERLRNVCDALVVIIDLVVRTGDRPVGFLFLVFPGFLEE